MSRKLLLFITAGLIGLIVVSLNFSQSARKVLEAVIEGHVSRPETIPFNDSLVKQLQLPRGFQITVWAKGLGKPRMMAVNSDGTVFVTRPEQKDVVALRDRNQDGLAEGPQTIASNLNMVHGITIHDNKLYLCTVRELYVADLPNGKPGKTRVLIKDLPDGGQHPKRTIGFDKAGNLYISIGSTCNDCVEDNEEHATILKTNPDGSSRTIYARGLRNTIGFDWDPQTGQLWGMDHGSDWRGDDQPPEELNRLQEGGNYGWPFCFAEKEVDEVKDHPEGTTKEAYCAKTLGSTLTYQAHSAPIEMIFYKGSQFPSDYLGDAFVAMHGSWNRKPPTGYKVVRVVFENGKPVGFEDFVIGFLLADRSGQFGRPAGLAELTDGSLLISDDDNGVIYRVTYGPQASNLQYGSWTSSPLIY